MNRNGLLLLLAILLPYIIQAKGKENYYTRFNSDSFWHRLVIDNGQTPLHLSPTDTAIIVASNRATGKTALRFMSELRCDSPARFFLVYTKGAAWHVRACPALRTAVSAMPQRNSDWVVYAEGMGKIFTTDIDRGIAMSNQYGVNVLMLDYPSIRSDYKALRNYLFVLRNARSAYTDFAPVLDSFRKLRTEGSAGSGRLTLFFHSMGNHIIRRIAQTRLVKHFNDTVWVDNLVLNAPCVASVGSTEWIDRIRFARRVYVHYNPHDATLKWPRLLSLHAILGERPELPLSRRAAYISFNQLCGDGHSNFLSRYSRCAAEGAAEHYKKLLHGQPAPLSDGHIYGLQADGIGWYLKGEPIENPAKIKGVY